MKMTDLVQSSDLLPPTYISCIALLCLILAYPKASHVHSHLVVPRTLLVLVIDPMIVVYTIINNVAIPGDCWMMDQQLMHWYWNLLYQVVSL